MISLRLDVTIPAISSSSSGFLFFLTNLRGYRHLKLGIHIITDKYTDMQLRHLATLLIASLMSCGGETSPGGGTTPTQPVVPVATSITLSASSISLNSLGQTASLTAVVTDQNGAAMSGQAVAWSSSDTGVVTVSNGTVTAVADGSATITATSGTLTATASAIVGQEPSTISLSSDSLIMRSVGAEVDLTAAVLDALGGTVEGAVISWTSSDEGVATISFGSTGSEAGTVTAVANGSATITATSGTASATASVTVAQIPSTITLSST
ncbi:MAG TPA: hypothetical protein DCY33_07315, partial [Gemmatimonadetes bacterium]|nr:hypothetical protein [Gemmatimonadota bacterium]